MPHEELYKVAMDLERLKDKVNFFERVILR